MPMVSWKKSAVDIHMQGAKSILQDMHPEAAITTVEISQESVKYAMELEDFIKNAAVVEG